MPAETIKQFSAVEYMQHVKKASFTDEPAETMVRAPEDTEE
jgi:hypothetical protein